MSRQIRNIIISVCAIAVLVVVMVVIKNMPSSKSSSPKTSSAAGISLIKLDKGKVATIGISNSNGNFTIRKSGSSTSSNTTTYTWSVDELSGYPLSQSVLDNVAEEATAVTATQTVSTTSSDKDKYGLASPKSTMTLKSTDGKEYVLYIGNATPTKSGYYAMLKDKEGIYIVSSSTGDDFTASAKSMLDTGLVTLETSKLTTLTSMTFGGASRSTPIKLAIDATAASTYSATTDTSGSVLAPTYDITSPAGYTANSTSMNGTVSALMSLAASDIVSLDTTDKTLTQYGLKNPAYTFSFTYEKKNYTLSFGSTFTKDSTEYIYIMVNGKNVVYSIATSSVPFYKYQLGDLMPTLIYSPKNIDTVKTVTVVIGSKTWKYNLTGTGDALKITSDGKTLKTDQFRNLYQQYISLSPQGTASDTAGSTVLGSITFDFRTGGSDVITFKSMPDSNDPTKIDGYKALCIVNGNANFYIKKAAIDTLAGLSQDIIDGKSVPAT